MYKDVTYDVNKKVDFFFYIIEVKLLQIIVDLYNFRIFYIILIIATKKMYVKMYHKK